MPKYQLDEKTYNHFKLFLQNKSGIVLGDNKQYLVKSRLSPLLSLFNQNSLIELIHKALHPNELSLSSAVIDAMTTNETLWFRDQYPFVILQNKILPELTKHHSSIKIWSAASSSGQEPYSIAMAIEEFKQQQKNAFMRGVQIIGTDISKAMLKQSEYGHYDQLALARGLSEQRKKQFFQQGDNNQLKIKPNIRAMVKFKQFNLLEDNYHLGKFDIIFCRNVLIYFSADLKKQVINKLYQSLNPNGYLILGASESIEDVNNQFNLLRCNPGIIYQKK